MRPTELQQLLPQTNASRSLPSETLSALPAVGLGAKPSTWAELGVPQAQPRALLQLPTDDLLSPEGLPSNTLSTSSLLRGPSSLSGAGRKEAETHSALPC